MLKPLIYGGSSENPPKRSGFTNYQTTTTNSIMNKGELIEAVQKSLGGDTSKKAAEEAVKAVLETIAKGVKKDGSVQLIGFGTFEVRKRSARTGRNPKTGETIKIKASKTVGFKPSSALKGSL